MPGYWTGPNVPGNQVYQGSPSPFQWQQSTSSFSNANGVNTYQTTNTSLTVGNGRADSFNPSMGGMSNPNVGIPNSYAMPSVNDPMNMAGSGNVYSFCAQLMMSMVSVVASVMQTMMSIMPGVMNASQNGGLNSPSTGSTSPSSGIKPDDDTKTKADTPPSTSSSGDGSAKGAQAVTWANSKFDQVKSGKLSVNDVRKEAKATNFAWCAAFVSTAFEKTGGSPWGHETFVAGIWKWAKNHPDKTEIINNKTLPKVGDVAIWLQGSGPKGHTGIVSSVDPAKGTFTVTEGNSGGTVKKNTYNINGKSGVGSGKTLQGFVRVK